MQYDKIIDSYIRLRDRIAARKDAFEKEVAPMKAKLEEVESFLLGELNRQNLQSFSTPFGTAFKSQWTKANVTDWEALHRYIMDNDRMDLLERRVSKTNVLDTIAQGDTIPGVTIESGYTCNIRRK